MHKCRGPFNTPTDSPRWICADGVGANLVPTSMARGPLACHDTPVTRLTKSSFFKIPRSLLPPPTDRYWSPPSLSISPQWLPPSPITPSTTIVLNRHNIKFYLKGPFAFLCSATSCGNNMVHKHESHPSKGLCPSASVILTNLRTMRFITSFRSTFRAPPRNTCTLARYFVQGVSLSPY